MSSNLSFNTSLNSNYLFENYVAGNANQLALSAATQVADSQGTNCNPLFIYGGVGAGKTHLIQAIGNRFKAKNNQAKVRFIHTRTYVSGFVRALQTKQFINEFRQYFNSLDLLLLDDIQFLAEKPESQQELFDTLSSLIKADKQVVITGGTSPAEMSGIEPQLINLFTRGFTVAIEPSTIEMRVAILLQKSTVLGTHVGNDIAYYVAEHLLSDSTRELEGALARINAHARFHDRPITVDLVDEAIFTPPFQRKDKNGISGVALHRIHKAALTDEAVKRPADIDLDEYIQKGGMSFANSKTIRLSANISEFLARILEETPLSEDQKLKIEGNHTKLTATVADTWQLTWWIMAYGDNIEVTAPVALRRKISGLLTDAANQYASEFARFELTHEQDDKLKKWLPGVSQRAAKKQEELEKDDSMLNRMLKIAASRKLSDKEEWMLSRLKKPYPRPLPYYADGGGISFTFEPTKHGVYCRATESITGEFIHLDDLGWG